MQNPREVCLAKEQAEDEAQFSFLSCSVIKKLHWFIIVITIVICSLQFVASENLKDNYVVVQNIFFHYEKQFLETLLMERE